jgi:hypothetical protein
MQRFCYDFDLNKKVWNDMVTAAMNVETTWLDLTMSARLDVQTWIEANHDVPPVVFESFDILTQWAHGDHEFKVKVLAKRRNGEPAVALVEGFFRSVDPSNRLKYPYRQLWTLAAYRYYRRPFAKYHSLTDNVPISDLKELHADHVVNSGRLKSFPKSWVMLFPVNGQINSAFGLKVEKSLPKIERLDEVIYLGEPELFKILAGRWPKDCNDAKKVCENFRGNFLDQPHLRARVDGVLRTMESYLPY